MKHNLTKELLKYVIFNFSLTIYAYIYMYPEITQGKTNNQQLNDDDVNDA